jgi:thiol-disulfide isomerase/thioredoxin
MKKGWSVVVIFLSALGFVCSLILLPVGGASANIHADLVRAGAIIDSRPVPVFQLVNAVEENWSLSQRHGQIIYLNFWGEFCDACKQELPSLAEFAEQYIDSGLEVVVVAIDDDPGIPRAYLEQTFGESLPFTVLFDPGGQVAAQFGTVAVPETYIIEENGLILARFVGEQSFLSGSHLQLATLLVEDSNL